MNITKFKYGPAIVVEYEQGSDVYKISTHDKPEKPLIGAMSDFTIAAIALFKTVPAATFYSLAVSSSDDPVSRIELEIPTAFMNEYGRLKLPAVSRDTVYDKSMEPVRDDPRNIYNDRLTVFLERIKEYAAGKRAQRELFDRDEEEAGAADRIRRFPKQGLV